MDDAMDLENFSVGPNLPVVDLTALKSVVRAPVKPVMHHTHTQNCDRALSVALNQDIVLQPLEFTVERDKMVTNDIEPQILQRVVLNASIAAASLQYIVVLEDCVAAFGKAVQLFFSIINLSSRAHRVCGGTHLTIVVPVALATIGCYKRKS